MQRNLHVIEISEEQLRSEKMDDEFKADTSPVASTPKTSSSLNSSCSSTESPTVHDGNENSSPGRSRKLGGTMRVGRSLSPRKLSKPGRELKSLSPTRAMRNTASALQSTIAKGVRRLSGGSGGRRKSISPERDLSAAFNVPSHGMPPKSSSNQEGEWHTTSHVDDLNVATQVSKVTKDDNDGSDETRKEVASPRDVSEEVEKVESVDTQVGVAEVSNQVLSASGVGSGPQSTTVVQDPPTKSVQQSNTKTTHPTQPSLQQSMGLTILFMVSKRRLFGSVSRLFSKWKLDTLLELQTERIAENLSAKSFECKNLLEENDRIRDEMDALRRDQEEIAAKLKAAEASNPVDLKKVELKYKDHPVYGKFFKMLTVGIPLGAVSHKMVTQGLDEKVLECDPESIVPPHLMPEGSDSPTSALPKQNESQPPLLLKDHEVFGKFFKMLSVGIPRPAVAIKMKSQGVDESVLDMDPDSPVPPSLLPAASSTEEASNSSEGTKEVAAKPVILNKDDERYKEYFKMLNVGVPPPAVAIKMKSKGLDPAILDKPDEPSDANEKPQEESNQPQIVKIKDDPVIQPFLKMAKMGVPRGAIEIKMKSKDVDPKILDMDPESPSPLAAAAAAAPTPEVKVVKIKDDPVIQPFLKMAKMGVPRGAIEIKMKSKDVDPKILDMDPESPSPLAAAAAPTPEVKVVKIKDDPAIQPFLKMAKMGVPRGAIEIKMKSKDIDPKVLDMDPESPSPLAAAAAAAAPTPEVKVVKIKDDPAIQPFLKMVKMGVPRGAIEIKMKSKDVDPKILDMDPESPSPLAAAAAPTPEVKVVKIKDDPAIQPFLKMVKMGVPRGAIEIKMKSKDVDPKILDMDPESPSPLCTAKSCAEGSQEESATEKEPPQLKVKDDVRYAQFFNMLKVGVPREAVIADIEKKGLNPAVLDLSPDDLVPLPPAIKDDPKYQPFLKMLKAGVPRMAVELQMSKKKIDPAILDMDPNKPPTTKVGKKSGPGGNLVKQSGARNLNIGKSESQDDKAKEAPPAKPKEKIARKKLHWRKLPARKLKEASNSVWNKIFPFKFDDREVMELQTLFTVKLESPTKKKKAASNRGGANSSSKVAKVTILEMQRANNVSIVMSRLPGSDAICRAINTLSLPADVNPEDLKSVLHLLPNEQEVQALKAYTGDRSALGKAELHFLKIMEVERYAARSRCLLYKVKYEEAYEDVDYDLEQFDRACNEILENDSFQRLLEIVLALGNFLNEGSPHAAAPGFALDSLTKLKTVKSYGSKTSALHYLVLVVQTRQRQVLNFMTSEAECFRGAANVSWTNVVSETKMLQNGLKVLENELNRVAEKYSQKSVQQVNEKAAKSGMPDSDGNGKVPANTALETGKLDQGTTSTDLNPSENPELESDQTINKSTDGEEDDDPNKMFYLSLHRFYHKAKQEVDALVEKQNMVDEKFKRVLEFYCEDTNTTPDAFFKVITTFVDDFKHAQQQNDLSKAKALKRARARRAQQKGSKDKGKAVAETRNEKLVKSGIRHAKSTVELPTGKTSSLAKPSIDDEQEKKGSTSTRDVVKDAQRRNTVVVGASEK